MKLHKEGNKTLLLVTLALIALNLLMLNLIPAWAGWIIFSASILLFLFFLQFFRNPERIPPEGDDFILSPADGKVVVIEKTLEKEYFQDERLQVSIFMSPLDVHLNRVPISGKLIYYKYHPGKYLMAFNPKSSELNERNTIVIENKMWGKFLLRQIAGFAAKRISFFYEEGAELNVGDEMGFIKFGSRCDIFLPPETNLNVSLGEQVFAGKTIISYLNPSKS